MVDAGSSVRTGKIVYYFVGAKGVAGKDYVLIALIFSKGNICIYILGSIR